MKLESGQVAVVTGAASGVGLALVEAFVARGLQVVAADIEPDVLETSVKPLVEAGAELLTRGIDVRSLAEVQALSDATADRFGRVDLVVNNAGVLGRRAYLWEQDEADWRWIQDVNICGVMNGIRTFVPQLIEAGHGHVVNTSSLAGIGLPGAGHGNYAASKHAIVALTEVLRHELESVGAGVSATVLCPGRFASRIREGERLRPAEYSGSGREVTPIVSMFDDVEPFTAEEVAVAAVRAIEADRLYVPVGPGAVELTRGRAERILESLDQVS